MKYRGKIVPPIGLMTFRLALLVAMVSVADAAVETGRYVGPSALAASKDATTLYVACSNACEIACVRISDGKVSRRVGVPAEPTAVVLTPDARKLIVTCAAPKSTVAVLDAASGDLLATIPVGHTADGPVLSPDGERLYVCNRFDNDVSVVDLDAGKVLRRIPVVREPIAAALTPDGRTLLVANHLPSTRSDPGFSGEVAPVVSRIDTQTYEATEIALRHGANGLRDVCVLPDGKHALVTHLLSNFESVPFRVDLGWINVNVVSILDIEQRKVISTIGLDEYDLGSGNPYGVTPSVDGKSVCVTLAGAHELCVIDTTELLGELAHRTMQPMMRVWPIYFGLGESLWRRIELPGKGPRGMAVAGSKVYVAQYFSDTVAVYDLQSGGDAVETIALGPSPQLTQRRRGELLFHDAKICYQQWQSCASCHPDGRVDGLNWDLLNDGPGNPKNTKSLLLAHRTPPAMAEGVRPSAEMAVRSGLKHILFANWSEQQAVAIDAYLASLEPIASPHLVDGRLSPAAERGERLFGSERVGCHRCHPAPLYTDLKMHSFGKRSSRTQPTGFDTPTLVEVWRTAPYLHNGRYTTIRELLVEGRHGLRPDRSEELSEDEMADLVEFVLSL